LRILAESPHNVGALIGAGKAALELGDAQGALTFFARAEQDAPRDGWVKKWEGSALVQLEQPAAALKFFRDAVSLGVPDASVAGDRGLAWDISGDPRRAQRDYRLALSQGSDPELTRRLALSLAISGEREPALQLLQDQLMRRDRAAYRTRAFVLALTGDWQDADRDVEAALPAQQAAGLEPFLARLSSLSLADRALAVHLGRFPGSGRAAPPAATYAQNNYAQNSYSGNGGARSNLAALPPGYRPTPQPTQSASSASLDAVEPEESRPAISSAVAAAEPAPTAPRRIPGAQSETPRPRPAPAVAARRTQSYEPPVSQWSWSRGDLPSMPHRAPVKAASQSPVRPPAAAATSPEAPTHARTEPRPVEIADARAPAVPPVTRSVAPPPAAAQSQPAPRGRLAEVAAALDRIEDTQRARRVAAAVQPDEARPAARPQAAARKVPVAEAREPARHWVQLAHAADPDVLPREYGRLKDKAPKLFTGRTVWTAPGRSTSRLLVGPFESEEAAQRFVDRLEKADVTGLAWTSDAGQKVEKLTAR
jgi:Flp pilus assembly protein TadD